MKQKHTPGPWRIGDASQTIFGPRIDGPIPAETIASMIRNKANARLIAAAPEMLEVLNELLVEALEGAVTTDTIEKANLAIEKAEGR